MMDTTHKWRAVAKAANAVLHSYKKLHSKTWNLAEHDHERTLSEVVAAAGASGVLAKHLERLRNHVALLHKAVAAAWPEDAATACQHAYEFLGLFSDSTPYWGAQISSEVDAGLLVQREASALKTRAESDLLGMKNRSVREKSDLVDARQQSDRDAIVRVLGEHRSRPQTLAELLRWMNEAAARRSLPPMTRDTLRRRVLDLRNNETVPAEQLPPLPLHRQNGPPS